MRVTANVEKGSSQAHEKGDFGIQEYFHFTEVIFAFLSFSLTL